MQIARLVETLVPEIYATSRRMLRQPASVDVSRSNQCHALTLDLFNALKDRGIPVRRELHQQGRNWHYVINHSPTGTPSDRDVITDLTPWQIVEDRGYTGHLHGERRKVQQILSGAGADAGYVALRGIATITRAHDERFWIHSKE